eukprot:CAMPEP_0114512216 /NCGR_PEP_ID=MMETSP0109-20121206/14846_1 /TAXON_ID=29199 /ORGANISM="Chlorarachnion reptans, Strain CCCM449" /LENGTH=68 /DNA_ID=CAMNT_0001691863 /DNA_START=305 /DNA_END=511 /DNA_ORIENTATION=+
MSETSDKDTELEGMTYWQIFYEFMTGGYLWRKFKEWKGEKIEEPSADIGQSKDSETAPDIPTGTKKIQ